MNYIPFIVSQNTLLSLRDLLNINIVYGGKYGELNNKIKERKKRTTSKRLFKLIKKNKLEKIKLLMFDLNVTCFYCKYGVKTWYSSHVPDWLESVENTITYKSPFTLKFYFSKICDNCKITFLKINISETMVLFDNHVLDEYLIKYKSVIPRHFIGKGGVYKDIIKFCESH